MGGNNKRTGICRRKYQYDGYLPERRSGKDRREDQTPADFDETFVENMEPAQK